MTTNPRENAASGLVSNETFILAETADSAPGASDYRIDYAYDARPRETGPTFRDDVVLAVAEDSIDDAVQLAPAEGISPGERRLLCMTPIPLTEEEEPQRPLTQFSLWELMVLTTFLSVGLAIMSYLPVGQVAGVLGLLALLGQMLLMRFPPENRHIKLGAACLLAMYVVAAAVAFLQHIFAWGKP